MYFWPKGFQGFQGILMLGRCARTIYFIVMLNSPLSVVKPLRTQSNISILHSIQNLKPSSKKVKPPCVDCPTEASLRNVVVPSQGQTVAILGPNGAGKSTLLKSLAATLPLREGQRIEGEGLKLGIFTQVGSSPDHASPGLNLSRGWHTDGIREGIATPTPLVWIL